MVAGGPAAKAGIKAGDHIRAVDGESVESLGLPSLRMEIANRVSRKQLRSKMNSEGTIRNVTVMPRISFDFRRRAGVIRKASQH